MALGQKKRTLLVRGGVAAAWLSFSTLTAGWIDYAPLKSKVAPARPQRKRTKRQRKQLTQHVRLLRLIIRQLMLRRVPAEVPKAAQPALQPQQRVRVRGPTRSSQHARRRRTLRAMPDQSRDAARFGTGKTIAQNRAGWRRVRANRPAATRRSRFFYQPDRESQVHLSIKAEVRKVLGELPAETLAEVRASIRASGSARIGRSHDKRRFVQSRGRVRANTSTRRPVSRPRW